MPPTFPAASTWFRRTAVYSTLREQERRMIIFTISNWSFGSKSKYLYTKLKVSVHKQDLAYMMSCIQSLSFSGYLGINDMRRSALHGLDINHPRRHAK